MKLLIAIPALNEETSIESIIKRSLSAREEIIKKSPVDEVEITVVSDGSTDRTVEIAKRYEYQINLIVFEKNRGYGAAIKEAWIQSDAELLSFLDADGTCDPLFFSDLCQKIETEQADVVLGCRLNSKSKMPLVRRIGNAVYALLLTTLSSSRVRDTASGMRVVRRSSLMKLLPLPDGLHFTPAMSARAILSGDVKILEIDMPYEERAGESKLSLWKDGMRFLKVILESAFLYCPSRILDILGVLCALYGFYLMLLPSLYYLEHRSLQEWMIYRFVVAHLVGMAACLLICVGHLSRKILDITLSNRLWQLRNKGVLGSFFTGHLFWFVVLGLFVGGGLFVVPSFFELLQSGATYEHWSRFIAMSFLISIVIILLATRALVYTLNLVAGRVAFLRERKHSEKWFKSMRKDPT